MSQDGGPPDFIETPSVTRAPFRTLTVLVVITVVGVWVQALSQLLGATLGRYERYLVWVLPVITMTLLLATVVMRQARHRAIAASQLAGWRLSAFTSASNEVAWETTIDGIVTFAGPHLADVLGYQPSEVVGVNSAQLLATGEVERLQRLRTEAITRTKGWTDQPLTYVTRSGQPRQLSTSALLRLSRDGAPIGFTGILRVADAAHPDRDDLAVVAARVGDVLAHGGLQIALQPIVSTRSGALLGAEALSRFPGHPQIATDRWFDDAAQVGLGADLELFAMTNALASATRLPPSTYLSINTSPGTLATGEVTRVIQQASWPPSQVVVEITEHASVDHYDHLRPAIEELHAMGVRLAVDDAGSGYASFRHILELRPDYIKLDRQLIDGIDHDPAKRALVVALVSFGREVAASIVAEGIETANELATVTRLGVDAAQGYHIGPPQLTGAVSG